MTATEHPTEADNLRQMLRFHMDRAERHRLRAEKAEGPRRLLWGLRALDRGVLRQGQSVLRDGAPVGQGRG